MVIINVDNSELVISPNPKRNLDDQLLANEKTESPAGDYNPLTPETIELLHAPYPGDHHVDPDELPGSLVNHDEIELDHNLESQKP